MRGLKDDFMRNSIERGNKNIYLQNINRYKKNVRFDYDELIIKQFRKKFPKKVRELEKEAIEKLPYLRNKCYKKFLDKKVDYLILPPILEKPDGHFFWDKSSEKGKTSGGYNLPLETYIDTLEAKDSSETRGGRILMDEILEGLLDELGLEENTLIKMFYGIEPYEQEYSPKEIYKILDKNEKEKLGLTNLSLKDAEDKIEKTVKEILSRFTKRL